MMNKPWMKVLRWIGYVAFFVVALLVFVRLTFPTDQAKNLAKAVLTEKLGAQHVEISDLSIGGLILPSSVSLEKLEIGLPPIKIKTPERGVDVEGPVRLVSVDELSVSGSVFGLLGGKIDSGFEGKLGGGEISEGRLVFERGQPITLEVTLAGIELGSESMFLSLTGFDVFATLGGKIKVEVPTADNDGKVKPLIDQLSGDILLELGDARIFQHIIDTVMNREPVRMAFTDTTLGNVTIKLKAEGLSAASGGGGGAVEPPSAGGRPGAIGATDTKGNKRGGGSNVIAVEELSAVGGNIEIAVAPKGTITIPAGGDLKDATINVHLAVRIDDAWFDISVPDPKDKTKTTKPNVGVRTMLTMGPLKSHVQDGQFGIGITGPLNKPKVVPERPRTRVGAGGAAVGGSSRKVNVDVPGGEGEDESDTPAAPKSRPAATPPATESKSKPIPTPPIGERGGNASKPIVRPAIGAKGGPSERIVRPRPRIVDPTAPPEAGEHDGASEEHAPTEEHAPGEGAPAEAPAGDAPSDVPVEPSEGDPGHD